MLKYRKYEGKVENSDKCHKEGLWHKAVTVFKVNSKSQVLLQRRSNNKKLWTDMWDVTAGGQLAGKFGFQAIIRETKEKLGIELDKSEITFLGSAISRNVKDDIINNYFNEYYVANKDIDETKLKI